MITTFQNEAGSHACDSQTIRRQLEEAGVRPSPQRTAVLEWLSTHPVHPTADAIYAALSPEMPTLSKTTVYNTLKTLEDHGLIQSLHLESENVHFDADTSFHGHFICNECHSIEDIWLDEKLSQSLKASCPEESDHSEVSFYGLCKNCRQV